MQLALKTSFGYPRQVIGALGLYMKHARVDIPSRKSKTRTFCDRREFVTRFGVNVQPELSLGPSSR